jgi:hypothetical protein
MRLIPFRYIGNKTKPLQRLAFNLEVAQIIITENVVVTAIGGIISKLALGAENVQSGGDESVLQLNSKLTLLWCNNSGGVSLCRALVQLTAHGLDGGSQPLVGGHNFSLILRDNAPARQGGNTSRNQDNTDGGGELLEHRVLGRSQDFKVAFGINDGGAEELSSSHLACSDKVHTELGTLLLRGFEKLLVNLSHYFVKLNRWGNMKSD